MRLSLDPERALPIAAIALGLAVGTSFIMSSGVPGCAAEQCISPPGVELPAAVIECPSGTLCYQGSCLPSCASGAENAEKCESDSDCSSAARPNCVDRHCSSCEEGQRCVPALNICSSVKPNAVDGGSIIGDSGLVPATRPIDGGTIDGSVLRFDSGIDTPPPPRPVTHIVKIDLTQRVALPDMDRTLSGIEVSSLDIRNTGRVVGSTVAPPIVDPDNTQKCQIVSRDQYPMMRPVSADVGDILMENEANAGADGLIEAHTARFMGGVYDVIPAAGLDVPLFRHSAAGSPTYVSFHGPGMMGVNGSWPPGAADPIATPERLQLSVDAINSLRSVDLSAPGARFEIAWVRSALQLRTYKVEFRVETPDCVLTCAADEDKAQLEIPSRLAEDFRTQCNGAGRHTFTLDRVSSRRLNPASDESTGALVELSAAMRDGYIGRVTF